MQPAPRATAETIVMTLRPRARAAETITETDGPIDEPLDAQTADQQRRQHHAGVGHRPLIVERYDAESFTMKVTC